MPEPQRPDHPDFWELSAVLIDEDTGVKSSEQFGEFTARFVDPEVLVYVARQRVLRTPLGQGPYMVQATGCSIWMDGFLAGVQFKRGDAGLRTAAWRAVIAAFEDGATVVPGATDEIKALIEAWAKTALGG